MNSTEKVLSLILIVMIILFIGISIYPKLHSIVDKILNLDKPQEILSKPSINEFKKITVDYEKCLSSQKNKCLCDINIVLFPERYLLAYEQSRLDFSMVKKEYATRFSMDSFVETYNNIKNLKDLNLNMVSNSGFMGSGATIGSSYKNFNGNINCYVGYTNKNTNIKNLDTTSFLLLDSLGQAIITEKLFGDIAKISRSHNFINKKPTFYKEGNNICFVLEDKLSKDGIDYINKLQKC
jgi:hypothetical protein